MLCLLIAVAISADDASVKAYVDACEKRRPELIAELESQVKSWRARIARRDGDPKEIRKKVDELTKDIEALKRFDVRCIGLCGPLLDVRRKWQDDTAGPNARQPVAIEIPRLGEILRVEQTPATVVADRAERMISANWPHGLIVLSHATDLQLQFAESGDVFYMPPVVQVMAVKPLANRQAAVIVKEIEANDLASAWLARHPAKVAASSRK